MGDPQTYTTGTGQRLVNVHKRSACHGPHCPIHNPSERAERIGPTHWRSDRGIMERICEHGIGHPDPDAPLPPGDDGTHGCDGCCHHDHTNATLQANVKDWSSL